MKELLEIEITNDLEHISNWDPSAPEYSEVIKNLKVLADTRIELEKLELERERIKIEQAQSEAREDESKKDRRADVIKTVFITLATLGIGLMTIHAEGTRVITSKAVGLMMKIFPRV